MLLVPPLAGYTMAESGSVRRRRAAAMLALAVLLLAGSAAQAQRLLTLVPGVGSASSASGQGPSIGPLPTAVQVDLELLRGDPSWLEVPTPDGDVLSADRSVFEDRGDGDLMWSGGQPGAGYDTVVLTVEGGRLVGHFAAAGGGAYRIHAERDGRGGMAPVGGPDPDSPVPLCGVHEDAEEFHDAAPRVAAAAHAADPPRRVSNPQSHDRLDILAIYTATAAENWADRGGPEAAIRHAGDYLKMVFRNNQVGVEPHIVHMAKAPPAVDRTGEGLEWRKYKRPLKVLAWRSGELLRLRHEHRADLVHVFSGDNVTLLGACGSATRLTTGQTARSFSVGVVSSTHGSTDTVSWSTVQPAVCGGGDYVRTFAHEIGHGLGAHHDPTGVSEGRQRSLFRPYAMGHVDNDAMPKLGTAMSIRGQIEPFFSTPRIRPWGAVLGIAGEQDNERLVRETVHMAVRYSDYLEPLEGLPAQPTDLRVRFDGGTARLSWRNNAPDADGHVVRHMFSGGGALVEGRTEAVIPLATTEPGSWHWFYVRARKGNKWSLRSDWVELVVPGDPLAAPSNVSVDVHGWEARVEAQWTDNSHNEEYFDVELLKDGKLVARNREPAGAERSEFSSAGVHAEAGVEYGVRVLAYSRWGVSESSEVATFQWAPEPPPRLTASVTGPTTVRLSWAAPPEVDYRVEARLREWDMGRVEVRSPSAGPAWLDIEGLARGGRYGFEVLQVRSDNSSFLGSSSYLTLGERGDGPSAPSSLSWEVADNRAIRLNWRDNSGDELGFEVQEAGYDSYLWSRLLTVPPDTESVLVDSWLAQGRKLRVFAYNEHGFSRSSPPAFGPPTFQAMRVFPGDAEVRLIWLVEPLETLTGLQARWKPTADLPFDDADDRWRDLSASVGERRRVDGLLVNGEHTVTGLTNDTQYEFALRPLSQGGPHRTVWERVTPTAPKGICRADEETICLRNSRYEVKAGWWTTDGASGPGRVVPEGTDDSGLFQFFNPSNWEVLIKVLNGCSHNGRVWVLGASTTDLGYEITVTDTITEESRTYTNEPGRPAPAIVDTDAFSAPCAVDAAAR